MTLEDAIAEYKTFAEQTKRHKCYRVALEYAQVASWLEELKQWHEIARLTRLQPMPTSFFKPKDLEMENAKVKKAIFALAHCSREGSECDKCVMNGWQVEKIRMSDFELCDGIRELLQELDVVEKNS